MVRGFALVNRPDPHQAIPQGAQLVYRQGEADRRYPLLPSAPIASVVDRHQRRGRLARVGDPELGTGKHSATARDECCPVLLEDVCKLLAFHHARPTCLFGLWQR
jgi:hypothetical protein